MDYNFVVNLLDFFKLDYSYKTAKTSLLAVMITGFISYCLVIAYRVADPDTIIEGVTHYMNATWAIVGCGRWFLPIINILSGNIIMPGFIVMFYCLMMWLCAFIVCKIWEIDDPLLITVISMVMCVTPASISQLVATYMGVCFSLACLLSVLFVYFIFKDRKLISFIISIVCMVLSLALYQSYISMAACLTLMTLMLNIIRHKNYDVIYDALRAILAAAIGAILYFISNKVLLFVLHLQSSSRLAEFSFSKIFTSLLNRIVEMYTSYLNYFLDPVLFRIVFYVLIWLSILFSAVLFILDGKKDIQNKLFFIISLLLLPLASNIIGIITPDNPITVLMTYQNILIIPFAIALLSLMIKEDKSLKLQRIILVVVSLIICWSHTVSANATYQAYKLSHDYVYNQYAQVVYDVQHYEGYQKDKTPVLIAGFFDDSTLRKNIKTYNYAIDLFEDLVFWDTLGGATYNRHRYVMQYFGLDFIDFSIEDYQKIIKSKDFKNMSLWPSENGMKMINGYLVVKINDNVAK